MLGTVGALRPWRRDLAALLGSRSEAAQRVETYQSTCASGRDDPETAPLTWTNLGATAHDVYLLVDSYASGGAGPFTIGATVTPLAAGDVCETAVSISPASTLTGQQRVGDGRLAVKFKAAAKTTAKTGTQPLGLETGGRDGLLHVPEKLAAGPAPLMVLLHGAGGTGQRQLGRMIDAFIAAERA